MERQHPILIAGAGIGGLTAALSLLLRGHSVRVFEQASQLGEVGAGLQLSANATRALSLLGVADALAQIAAVLSGKEIRLWSSGQTWNLFDLGRSRSRSTATRTTWSTAPTCTAYWWKPCKRWMPKPSF